MSSDEAMVRLRAESERQADALAALMEGMAEEQQAALLEMAAQSHRAADWLIEHLSQKEAGQ
jgi:uncharacterized ferredoxin-like protein